MRPVPRERAPDCTLALLREGYEFLPDRFRRHGADLFAARVFGRRTICMTGPEAARVFYDPARFARAGAIPVRIQRSLFGQRAVQTLDDALHRGRKAMFLAALSPASVGRLVSHVDRAWREALPCWESAGRVTLFDEAARILCLAACRWAGVPLPDEEAPARAADFVARVDAFGAVGPRHWRGRRARARTERWMEGVVARARRGTLPVEADSPLAVVAAHRDADGHPLDDRLAAVELINMIRPTLAIAWFVTFGALALHRHPEWRTLLAQDDAAADDFVQEVRRFYPFAPFIGAKVRAPFDWNGCHFDEGRLVLLDLYGTNHDPRWWPQPDRFLPERFRQWQGSPFDFIPQGGGLPESGHRCPGEALTTEVCRRALLFLAREVRAAVPDQDLGFSLARMPTRPRSGFVMTQVRAA